MNKHPWKLAVVALLALALAAGGGAWWWFQGRTPDVSYRTGRIERGPLQATVSASGAVNPVTQVSVGTQISGQIKELYADFNSEVKAGQLIALIDPETFEYRVRQAQADVEAAQAAVLTATANVAAGRASLSRAQVDLNEAVRDYDRKKMLVDKQFIAQSEADKAGALVNSCTEGMKLAQAQLAVAEAQIQSAKANVAQRAAGLAQAKVDLTRTKITSPVDGIVIKRAIEKGQTVAASLQSPELFVIAQNLSDMEVDASIDESDVGRIRVGQRATFTVDAFPGQTFNGEVQQVRKAAQNVANVVTYVAVVGFSNAAGRLLPGMTANVRVVTESRENVLKIANAALRVRIAGVEPVAAPGARPASAASTGNAVGWGWLSQALAQPAGGGGMALRERLASELSLTAEQQAKLDAILAGMRPQFAALRDLPDDQRASAREKVLVHMRSQINAMLTPEQRIQYAQLQAAAANPARPEPVDGPPKLGQAQPERKATSQAANTAAPAAAASAAGSAGAEFRARLQAELKLTPSQLEKVDAIYADVRPKFMQLRDLPAEERTKARERISAEVRARIGELLTPEQKPGYAAILAESAGRTSTRGRIYLLAEDGKPRAFNVRLGITDGTSTELIVAPNSPDAAELKEGAPVIIGVNAPGSAPAKTASPRMAF
jgi:HlyD family secretion protein